MVRRVKNYKAGFVSSDSNLRLGDTLADVLALKERTGHSTMAVTDDGTGTGKLLGLVTSRDYRVSRMDPAEKVETFMTPAGEAHHRAGGHQPEGRQRHHLGPQAQPPCPSSPLTGTW